MAVTGVTITGGIEITNGEIIAGTHTDRSRTIIDIMIIEMITAEIIETITAAIIVQVRTDTIGKHNCRMTSGI
ncbi:hypothetical protein K7A28_00415 [Escherichia marmotae]|nr:hypothetical protein [Escherichia marmotae]